MEQATNTTVTTTNNIGYWSVCIKTREQIVAELMEKKLISTEEAAILLQKEYIYIPQPYQWLQPPYTITYANNTNGTN